MKIGRALLAGTISSFLAVIVVSMGFMPQLAEARIRDKQSPQAPNGAYSPEKSSSLLSNQAPVSSVPRRGIAYDLQALLAATTDPTDTDGDKLPDAAEVALGTDPNNVDSDFDTLDDYYEASNGLDPLKADSNGDGLPDNLEIKDVALDFDGDGQPNAWDDDNDSDGVRDGLDRSPFAKSDAAASFGFNIKTNGKPTYLDFQLTPNNAEHLRLPQAAWDWPADTEGQIQDRDGSTDDVQIYPMLELTSNAKVDPSELGKYGIVVSGQQPAGAGGFKIRGVALDWVDNYDYYTKNAEVDLVLFGSDNSSAANRRGYTVGFDTGSSFSPYRWGPFNEIGSAAGGSFGPGAFSDVSDFVFSFEKPEAFLPRIGGASIYQSPVIFGTSVDNYGHPTFTHSVGDFTYAGEPLYSSGSGLTVADIDSNGTPDLLAVFQIQGTGELACLIGWNLKRHINFLALTDQDVVASAWSYSPPLQITGAPAPLGSVLPSLPPFGANVANISVKIADVNGNGILDWILMGTDPGANQLQYRIGWDVAGSGAPSSWSEIMTSPGIGPGADGGGATAIDLNGNNKLDLVLMAVDDSENHSYHYVCGWDLDASGNPTGWSAVGSYGDNYDGFVTRGITIGDINRNGNPDIILLGRNEANDPNTPAYSIGWDVGATGVASRWSPIKDQTNYLSDSLGAAALTDINDNGQPEIYVPAIGAQIESSGGLIGTDLDAHGDQQKPGSDRTLEEIWAYFSVPSGHTPSVSAGSGLGIADFDRNGIPDFLTTYLIKDTGALAYIIGWNVDGSLAASEPSFGMPTAWSYSLPLQITDSVYGTLNKDPLPSIPSFGSNVTNISVKFAYLNGNPFLDWILMGTDGSANQVQYRIGWDMNDAGVPQSWSEIRTSPLNGPGVAGGGATATDLNGNGTPDLILVAVDSAEKHDYHYVIGWDMDSSGVPARWSQVYRQETNPPNRVYVPLTPVVDYGTNVAFSGRMFLPEGAPGETAMTARLVWMVTAKTDQPNGETITTRVAEYHEDFALTGFAATENYGTEGGLFYTGLKEQTMAAGFVLAYEFLRSQASLADMPQAMKKNKVTDRTRDLYSDIQSFPHLDAAMVGLTSDMMQDAQDRLPDGQILPVLIAVEDHSASVGLDEMAYDAAANVYRGDTSAAPLITAKMFRMNWYDTSTGKVVQEGIIDEMQKWGLTADELGNISRLVIAWSAGDYTITRIGDQEVPLPAPEQSQVLDTLGMVFDFGLQGVDIILSAYGTGIGIYGYLKSIPKITTSSVSLRGLWDAARNGLKAIEAARVGTIANVNAAVKWVDFAGNLLALGVAFYAFFDVAISYGWSEMGVTLGVWYFDLYMAYGLALVVIGALGPLGWIADLVLVIGDVIGGWFSDFCEWFIGLFYEATPLTEVNVDVKNSAFSFDDYDGDGLDVGDRVNLAMDIVEHVQTVPSTSLPYSQFVDSFIDVGLQCDGSNVSDQDNDRNYLDSNGDFIYYPASSNPADGTIVYEYNDQLFRNNFWAEPNRAAVNLPWKIWVNYDYKVFYKEEFMGSWEYKAKTGSGSSDPFIIYLDVFPGSLNDFLAWNEITRLDSDGDGLAGNGGQDPDPGAFDADQDGLSDGFETLMSMNPVSSDSDNDGLADLVEVRLGTNPLSTDTDDDGLSDSIEYNGWDITVKYFGQQVTGEKTKKKSALPEPAGIDFVIHVSSDPLMADTDGDGVSDFDEYSKPLRDCPQGNPRSQDTNGNGIKDQLNFVPVVSIDSMADVTEGETFTMAGSFEDPDPDAWTATVDYGDGSGIQPLALAEDKTFTLKHVFPLKPTGLLNQAHPYSCNYTVAVAVSDNQDGMGTANTTVTWHNFVPRVEAGQHEITRVGRELRRTATWVDPGLNDQVAVAVDWGDGSSQPLPDDGTYFDRTTESIYLKHTYSAAGTYTATVSVTDNFGDTGSDTVQIEVRTAEPPGQNKDPGGSAEGKGKDGAPGQDKEPGTPAEGKGKDGAPGQDKDSGTANGKELAPGQNNDSGEPAAGKGKDQAPGQNKGTSDPGIGEATFAASAESRRAIGASKRRADPEERE